MPGTAITLAANGHYGRRNVEDRRCNAGHGKVSHGKVRSSSRPREAEKKNPSRKRLYFVSQSEYFQNCSEMRTKNQEAKRVESEI